MTVGEFPSGESILVETSLAWGALVTEGWSPSLSLTTMFAELCLSSPGEGK